MDRPTASEPRANRFTGRTRQRRTTAAVRAADRVARALITVGGVGTIAAVTLVCVFLVSVVVPIFSSAEVRPVERFERSAPPGAAPAHLAVDEYQILGWTMQADASIEVFRLTDGKRLARQQPFAGRSLTASTFAAKDGTCALGFADGSVVPGRIAFATSYLEPDSAPAAAQGLRSGETLEHEGGLVERTPEGQLRWQRLVAEFEDPFVLAPDRAIRLLDQIVTSSGPVVAALADDGKVRIKRVTRRRNLLTKKVTTTLEGGELDAPVRGEPPCRLLLTEIADNIYLVWRDGILVRFDTRLLESPREAELTDLVAEPEANLTALDFAIGRTTLVTGDSMGRVRGWFRVKPEGLMAGDGSTLVCGPDFPAFPEPVTALAISGRSRLVAAGHAGGAVRLLYLTSQREIAAFRAGEATAVERLVISPKEDGVVAATRQALGRWTLDVGHPEVSLKSIFTRIWYEGSPKPEHSWQSSSGTDAFEPKFGLVPLIFGTIKATFYSMLFALPLALLAAMFTSEFLRPSWRARIKPTIELMASLPSVVLGFLAALVFAPFVEGNLVEILLLFVTLPLVLLLGAHLWQLMTPAQLVRMSRHRLVFVTLALPVSIVTVLATAKLLEHLLFPGGLRLWLDSAHGSSVGGWILLLLPFAALATLFAMSRGFGRGLSPRRRGAQGSGLLLRFVTGCLLTMSLAAAAGFLLDWLGFDPRPGLLGSYIQRNALVVGFLMGFAVIPLVYTIAEDALSSVPEHLRAASLGAGATPWQTATRIIVPTAASGLFSAGMIGLGRAVGETMIVLMATGNTPVLDWNVFNGFRTLSANIAVELPEAVQGSTHYRMLFLAALTLFAMTFCINTVAEVVRQRFRKRAFQL